MLDDVVPESTDGAPPVPPGGAPSVAAPEASVRLRCHGCDFFYPGFDGAPVVAKSGTDVPVALAQAVKEAALRSRVVIEEV